MAKNHNNDVDTNIESLSKAEAFIAKNNKKIVYGLVAAVALAVVVLAVRSFNENKAEAAQEAFTYTENTALMSVDSLSNAAVLADLEAYLDEFGGKSVGIAAFEAGIAAFEVKEYEKAIKFFSEYKGEDAIYNARALACIADCHVELGNYEKAYENYVAALNTADNDLAAEYAFRAGLVAEKLGNKADALAMYNTVKENYPSSPRATEILKYISRAEAK
ncbi:MAG: tetratricopeptide repeat protein [Bacteroidales bacterium]|nr:tetratricopeptide repeat protein [Bacteroidales bacterium]